MSDQGPSGFAIQRAMRIWHDQRKLLPDDGAYEAETASKEAFGVHTGGLEALMAWVVRAIREATMMATSVKAERDSLGVRQKRFEARVDGWRNTLAAIVETAVAPDRDGRRRYILPIATLTLAPTGRKLDISDEARIPDDFYTEVAMVKVRKGLRKDDLLRAMTSETIDEDTGEITPPLVIEGVTVSNGGAQLTIRGS